MPATQRIYLDHAASTPVLPCARAAVAAGFERWANPSSPHAEGRAARAMLEDARSRIAAALSWNGEVIFTSGATEAIDIALAETSCIASAVEHSAVLAAAGDAKRLAVGVDSVIEQAEWTAVRHAIQHANNETGVIQPIDAIREDIHRAGGSLFVDCSQSAGKITLPQADLIAVSAHKLGGPPGVGALLVRRLDMLSPSGGQEQGYRRGTENLPAVLGFAAALEAGFTWMTEASRLRALLDAAVENAGGQVVAKTSTRLATVAGYRMPGMSSSSQLIGFDMAGLSVSAGSACSSGTMKASHVLKAMGWDNKAASEVIRVSFGPQTSEAELERFIEVWRAVSKRAPAA